MESELQDAGFVRDRLFRTLLHSPDRAAYVRGRWRVLEQVSQQPFWTVQRLTASSVQWFVDFPLDCPAAAILAFIEMAESEAS
jgi:hypothetical protein